MLQNANNLDRLFVIVGLIAIVAGVSEVFVTGSSLFVGDSLVALGLVGVFAIAGGALLVVVGFLDARPESRNLYRLLLVLLAVVLVAAVLVLLTLEVA